MVIMPLYGHVYLISICKLDVICIRTTERHQSLKMIIILVNIEVFYVLTFLPMIIAFQNDRFRKKSHQAPIVHRESQFSYVY